MGFSPQQIDRMSVWQFMAALDGWMQGHGGGGGLTEAEKDELWDWMQTRPPVPASHRVH